VCACARVCMCVCARAYVSGPRTSRVNLFVMRMMLACACVYVQPCNVCACVYVLQCNVCVCITVQFVCMCVSVRALARAIPKL